MSKKIKSGTALSLVAGQATAPAAISQPITFCFAHLDKAQGHTLDEWEERRLLSKMIVRFRDFGTESLHLCLNSKFKKYKNFPPSSNFSHPTQVPRDAEWASMHLGNMPCVIGHILRGVFYVVFLDGDHEFWPSER